jgi:hypothetical protein
MSISPTSSGRHFVAASTDQRPIIEAAFLTLGHQMTIWIALVDYYGRLIQIDGRSKSGTT